MNTPVAWAMYDEHDDSLWDVRVSVLPPDVPGMRIVPLYEQPSLTDEEREAVQSAVRDYEQNDDDEDCARMVATLRKLLERLA